MFLKNIDVDVFDDVLQNTKTVQTMHLMMLIAHPYAQKAGSTARPPPKIPRKVINSIGHYHRKYSFVKHATDKKTTLTPCDWISRMFYLFEPRLWTSVLCLLLESENKILEASRSPIADSGENISLQCIGWKQRYEIVSWVAFQMMKIMFRRTCINFPLWSRQATYQMDSIMQMQIIHARTRVWKDFRR